MRNQRGLLLLVIPAASLALLAAVAIGARTPEVPPAKSLRPAFTAPLSSARVPESPERRRSMEAPRPTSTEREAVDVHIRATYENLRIAVASGNKAVQDVLFDALGPNRSAALRLAEEDLAIARTQAERDVTVATLDLLRRSR